MDDPPNIPTPNIEEVKKWLDHWDKDKEMESYRQEEKLLISLFKEYPKNENVDNIILKVLMLDKFYSTQIKNSVAMAKGILEIENIDDKLKKGDPNLVEEISKASGERVEYSFATKYCSFHNNKKFPIYDQYVAKTLYHFQNEYSNIEITYNKFNNELKKYNIFVKTINKFRDYYNLKKYSIKDIDRFLWQFGKEYFKK